MKILRSVVGTALALMAAEASAQKLTILSSRPDTVSGGDALVALALPRGAVPSDLKITVDGRDVTASFRQKDGSLLGLVSGLRPGRNKILASLHGRSGSLVVTNHDRAGPIFSGPHQLPFICETDRFRLPDGSTLGRAQDANCNAPTKVIFVYRALSGGGFKPLPAGPALPADMGTTTTANGRTVNYIVRVETGTINRAIYQIAVLFDPTRDQPPSPTAAYGGWNGRAVFAFGGGANAGYHQGAVLGDPLNQDMLSRGFALLNSTLNVLGISGSDLIAAETASMVKERFIETFGPPSHLIGWGGSGGSMQQHLIANNYPGILDGIIPGASFPDLYSLVPYPVDCALLAKTFAASRQSWSFEQKRAVSGLNTWDTCGLWNRYFTPEWVMAKQAPPGRPGNCDFVVPRALTYDPQSNPKGARCDVYTPARNTVGSDPQTGATYRAYDNVGVQYGLKAYRAGVISAEQFVELNEMIGGLDDDGNFQAKRAAASPVALRRMFEYGRINEGDNLDELPVIDLRGNPGRAPEVHDAVKSETMRARMIRSNGRADGHVMIRGESPGATIPGSGDVSHFRQMNIFALLKMDEWLSNMARDTRPFRSKADKVAANRPSDLATDICFLRDGTRIGEASTLTNAGPCAQKLPYFDDPRMAAGAPLTNDILKCHRRPLREADYRGMPAGLLARLKAVFPTGVCDYSRPSVGYRRLRGTWLTYPSPGVAVPMD